MWPRGAASREHELVNNADRSGRLWIGVVCAVVERDGALLLVHQGPLDEPERSWWALPGGVVEAGETLEDALRREVFEETGLRLGEVSSLLWTAEYTDDAHRGLTFIFRASCDDEADCAVDDPDGVVMEATWVPRGCGTSRGGPLSPRGRTRGEGSPRGGCGGVPVDVHRWR
jgi:8-oxo-dGTP diphosphatase